MSRKGISPDVAALADPTELLLNYTRETAPVIGKTVSYTQNVAKKIRQWFNQSFYAKQTFEELVSVEHGVSERPELGSSLKNETLAAIPENEPEANIPETVRNFHVESQRVARSKSVVSKWVGSSSSPASSYYAGFVVEPGMSQHRSGSSAQPGTLDSAVDAMFVVTPEPEEPSPINSGPVVGSGPPHDEIELIAQTGEEEFVLDFATLFNIEWDDIASRVPLIGAASSSSVALDANLDGAMAAIQTIIQQTWYEELSHMPRSRLVLSQSPDFVPFPEAADIREGEQEFNDRMRIYAQEPANFVLEGDEDAAMLY